MLGSSVEINDDLRRFREEAGEVLERLSGLGDDFGEQETSEDAVASGFVGKDDVAGLFAANGDVFGAHGFGDIGIADGGDFGGDV